MTTVLASAADEPYGYHLLNMLGSVKANSDLFDAIVVYDLGLTAHQRRLLDMVPGVEVRTVPPFVPHWAQGRTWKAWIWTHLEADVLVYLDAGLTVLRSLAPALEQIRARGYFLVSQGNELRDILPPDYFERYGIGPALASRPYAASGILGFRTSGEFYDRVVVATYEDCVEGLNLGFSADEVERRNVGLEREERPVIRDCPNFRWDQSVFDARLFQVVPDAFLNDVYEYAGWRSPRDHPRQVIWSHRRPGSLSYLKRVPYAGPGAFRARAFGARFQLRWWLKRNERFLEPNTYALKARAVLGRSR